MFLLLITAGMAELVDAYVSEAYAFTGVRVRLPLPAPVFESAPMLGRFFVTKMRPRWGRFDLFFRFVTPVGL